MSASLPAGAKVYLVTVGEETSILNRQQLLGSMPKILDALGDSDAITIEPVEQTQFTRALLMLREERR